MNGYCEERSSRSKCTNITPTAYTGIKSAVASVVEIDKLIKRQCNGNFRKVDNIKLNAL